MHLLVCFFVFGFCCCCFYKKCEEKNLMIWFDLIWRLPNRPNASTNQKLKCHQVMVNSFWSFPCFSIPHPPDAPTRILGMYVLVTVFLFCGHKKLTLDMLSQATWSQASITHTQLGTAAVIITVYLPVRGNQEIRFSFCRGFFLKVLL